MRYATGLLTAFLVFIVSHFPTMLYAAEIQWITADNAFAPPSPEWQNLGLNTPSGSSKQPVISADGTTLAFVSNAIHYNGETRFTVDAGERVNLFDSLFVIDLNKNSHTIIAESPTEPRLSYDNSAPDLSRHGDNLVFASTANQLSVDDQDRCELIVGTRYDCDESSDIYLSGPAQQSPTLLSPVIDLDDWESRYDDHPAERTPAISLDANRIVFHSENGQLAGLDTRIDDIVLYDLTEDTWQIISQTDEGQSLGSSFNPKISSYGEQVLFASNSDVIILIYPPPPDDGDQLHLYDRRQNRLIYVAENERNVPVQAVSYDISPQGEHVVYSSYDCNLTCFFIHHWPSNSVIRIDTLKEGHLVDELVFAPDNRHILYTLASVTDEKEESDIILYDRVTDQHRQLATGSSPSIDDRALQIAFSSRADYPELGDQNGVEDIFLLTRTDIDPNGSLISEYYHEGLNHYFLTGFPGEKRFVDQGGAGKWRRTELSYKAWLTAETAPPEAVPVCRFYGTRGIGPNSHFYTAHTKECEAVQKDPGWTLETTTAFYILQPTAGKCPNNTDPVFRYYNGRAKYKDSNHRYTLYPEIRPDMEANGWIFEGIVMCAPK